MSFVKDKAIGKIGEGIAKKLIEDKFKMYVEDVSEDSYWQEVDVDFLVTDPQYDGVNFITGEDIEEEPLMVEVKSDTTNTENIFFETHSNTKRGTAGNMVTTAADLLFYVHLTHEYVLTISIPKFRQWVRENKESFREVSVWSSNAKGLLIPLSRLVDAKNGEDADFFKNQIGVYDFNGNALSDEQLLEGIGK